MHRLERLRTGSRTRGTDFEIVRADKYNPTLLALKAVPKVEDYNPAPAFDWAIRQLNAVANNLPVDDALDSSILKEMADLAAKPRADGYARFWVRVEENVIHLDDMFAHRANAIFLRRRIEEVPISWHIGTAFGEVTGRLAVVSDIEGEQEFVLSPAAGPSQIKCKFREDQREEMRQHLFKVATVEGLLHYGEGSPHPYLVEMTSIRIRVPEPRHLLDMRGAFGTGNVLSDAGVEV